MTALQITARAVGDIVEGRKYTADYKARLRFAAPESWAVVAAVGEALHVCDEQNRDRIGAIALGDVPLMLLAEVAEQARQGFASPTKFPAASASATLGVTCIVHGLRGPTLSLTMPLQRGARVADLMARQWIGSGMADACIVFWTTGRPQALRASCVVLTAAGDAREETDLHDLVEVLAEVRT